MNLPAPAEAAPPQLRDRSEIADRFKWNLAHIFPDWSAWQVAYDLLEEAHRQGILDALHGAIGAKDTIAATLAHYSAEPIGVGALRNLLILGKLLGTLDPELTSRLGSETNAALDSHRRETEPPSLWQLFQRMRQPEARRGLSLLTSVLAALGRATK